METLIHNSTRGKSCPVPGFALVATTIVMSLLAVIALGMLSLSAISGRSISTAKHQIRAQANARLALMMAINQLQQVAGSDQVVTARADILASRDFEVSLEKRYLTGVWDSGQWDPRDAEEKVFKGWLVSGSPKEVGASDFALTNFEEERRVLLVGKGSVAEEEEMMWAERVDITRDESHEGGYAFVTLDNSVKANLGNAGKASDLERDVFSRLSASPRNALEVMETGEVKTVPAKDTVIQAVPSYQTSDLILGPEDDGDPAISNALFHDVTSWSYSLPVDVRLGGMKWDLSSAFEQEVDEFNKIRAFHHSDLVYQAVYENSPQKNDPHFYDESHGVTVGNLFLIPLDNSNGDFDGEPAYDLASGGAPVYPGPTWDSLRNHYRLYKNDWDRADWSRRPTGIDEKVYEARGYLPFSHSMSRPTQLDYRSPVSMISPRYRQSRLHEDMYLFNQRVRPTVLTQPLSASLAPSVIRLVFAVAFELDDESRLVARLAPFVTLHNPYNVPISFESLHFSFVEPQMFRFKVKVEYGGNKDNTKTFGWKRLSRLGTRGLRGNWAMRVPLGGQPIVMEPGTLKVFSPSSEEVEIDKTATHQNFIEITDTYSEDSSIFYVIEDDSHQENQGQKASHYTVYLAGGDDYGRFDKFDQMPMQLLYSKKADGSRQSQWEGLIGTDELGNGEPVINWAKDLPAISSISFNTQGLNPFVDHPTQDFQELPTRRAASQMGSDGSSYQYAVETRVKTPYEGYSTFYDFNSRFSEADGREYDSGSRTGPEWQMKMFKIDDISQLSLSGTPKYWGDYLYPGTGVLMDGAVERVVLHEVPRLPRTSLAQFQQLAMTTMAAGGSKNFGNSMAHIGLDNLANIAGRRPRMVGADIPASKFPTGNAFPVGYGSQILADTSWAANEALWDRCFFSSIHYGSQPMANGLAPSHGTLDEAVDWLLGAGPEEERPFFNPHVRFLPWNKARDGTAREELKAYDKIARYLAIRGGFNVNSTSVEAWKAMLSGLRGQTIFQMVGKGGRSSEVSFDDEFPLGSMALEDPSQNDQKDIYKPRHFSVDDVEELAEAIVKQVRLRGPFMGLADFVNRRLTNEVREGYELGKMGALQMAIEDAGLNDELVAPIFNVEELVSETGRSRNANTEIQIDGKKFHRNTLMGSPGYLMQADVLSLIGDRITARSDSFTVRGYGESRDEAGDIVARAWCEALVQRSSEWVSPTEKGAVIENEEIRDGVSGDILIRPWKTNPSFPEINKRLGRKFRVVSFRWLNRDEI